MLKTIIKETKGKQLQTLQLHKPLETSTVNKKVKPSIYQRVDKEKKRQKVIQTILFKSDYYLKRKYFSQLKFYHNVIQLRRRIKLSYKYTGFCIIQDYYKHNKEKYAYIISHFVQIRKIKVLAALYKEHILASKKNSILREVLISNFSQFIFAAKDNIASNYHIFNSIRLFYFRIFSNRIFLKSYSKACSTSNVIQHKRKLRKRYQIKVFKQIREYIRNKLKKKVLRRISAFDQFISRVKHQISMKSELKKSTKYYLIKSIYSKLISFTNNLHIEESKNSVSQMFYEEKMKTKCLNIFRAKNELMRSFRALVIKYKSYSISLIKGKIRQEKKKIVLLRQKYSKFKKQKLLSQKAKFFCLALKFVNQKKQKAVINRLYCEKRRKKGWDLLHRHWNLKKQFNTFLNSFISIHNCIVMQNALNLMRYKVHRFRDQNKLPKIVGHYVQNKLEEKIFKLQFKQMKKFYKKAKRFILNKKILHKKMNLAAYFDSKKRKVKCFENFKRFLVFIACRKKFNSFAKAKLCQMIHELPLIMQKNHLVQHSYRKYLFKYWIEQVLLSYTIINSDCLSFKKAVFLNWLISLKRRHKGNTLLSTLYLQKILKLTLFNRFKRKTIQIVLNQHYSKVLILCYITRLIKAKNSSLDLKSKFSTIKRECMNNLNLSN